ncbi:MAG: hypothetical protein ABSG31_16275 [Tepidisphaeraceae bacterium]
MGTLDDIVAAVRKNAASDSMTLYRECENILARDCVARGPADPYGSTNDEANKSVVFAANGLLARGLNAAAEMLLLSAWEKYAQRQLEEKIRVYRASISYALCDIHLRLANRAGALRWALLTHADDALGENLNGAARGLLHTLFGVSEDALRAFEAIVAAALAQVGKSNPAWDIAAGFAEESVRRFSEDDNFGAVVMSKAASENEFPISKIFLKVQMNHMRAVSNDKDTNAKGDALEEIAFYLFSLLPGCVPWPKVLHKDRIFETDLVARNLSTGSNLAVEMLGRRFLAECKNWAKPIGVSEVGYFLFRMRLLHAPFGVIFSQNDITGAGSMPSSDAADLIDRVFHEDGSICVVVSGKDLQDLESGKAPSFWWMLQHKIDLLRFGKKK